jgi:hypothetical protein
MMIEKRRRTLMSFSTFVGLVLVLLGVVLFLLTQDVLSDTEVLAYFLLGLGVIFLIDTIARYVQPYRRSFMWCRLTTSLVLMSAGGAVLGGIGDWWPLIVILVGAGLLINALLRR